MKRRTFLTTASTIGAVSVASSATVVSSVYNNLSTSVLLEDFDEKSKSVLDNFVSSINENTESLEFNAAFAKKMAMPTQIISIEKVNDHQSITYKNRNGEFVKLSFKDNEGRIHVLKTLD